MEVKSNGDLKFSNSRLMNQKIGEQKEKRAETQLDLVEEEQSTQPFWEGLDSDDEILKSRAERVVRDRKRKRTMERRMKALARARRNRRKRDRS
ncbi:hypothetical protein SLA2020_289840 [Shorea laevis]